MKLIGLSKNIKGVTVDLKIIGGGPLEKSYDGIELTYDKQDGFEKTERKGKKKPRFSLSGFGQLHVWQPYRTDWVDPQAELTKLEGTPPDFETSFNGEKAELQWDTGTSIGIFIIKNLKVSYAEYRPSVTSAADSEGYLEYRWSMNLTASQAD